MLLHDIQAKILLSSFLLRCASLESADTTVLDADAFYCTNIDLLADDAESVVNAEVFLLPEKDFAVSSLFPLLSSKRKLTIIDDLNSLYSLASDGRMAHQLGILMRLLSWNANINGSWVIATAFRTDMGPRQGGQQQRSLTALGDQLIDTDLNGGSLTLKAGFKGRWPGDELVA
jgi:hypothetical protein